MGVLGTVDVVSRDSVVDYPHQLGYVSMCLSWTAASTRGSVRLIQKPMYVAYDIRCMGRASASLLPYSPPAMLAALPCLLCSLFLFPLQGGPPPSCSQHRFVLSRRVLPSNLPAPVFKEHGAGEQRRATSRQEGQRGRGQRRRAQC